MTGRDERSYAGLFSFLAGGWRESSLASQEAGTLTPEMLARALDEMWRSDHPRPVPRYARGRGTFGAVTIDLGAVPRHPWAVEADGWQLVIEGGAIAGLRHDHLTVPGYCHRCRRPLGPVSWDAADYVFCRRCAKAEDVYTPAARPGRSVRTPRA